MTVKKLQTKRIQFYQKPAMTVNSQQAKSVADIFHYITTCQGAMEATRKLRSITDAKEYRKYKSEHFDFVCFSGLFSYRKDDCLLEHSGLICIDFDHLGERLTSLREELIADPYFETALLFVSPGGDGLKWVVEIDLSRADHRTWFQAIRNYVHHIYHTEADPQCINVSRACFLPYDVNCYVNPLISNF